MGELTSIYIFGSVGRGDHDSLSDLDLLAVVKDGAGKLEESYILSFIPSPLSLLKPSISWYGQNRISEMFENGELFAWHLHSDARPIFGNANFLESLGKPKPYRDGFLDVSSFQKVLRGIPEQISKNRSNAVYETGLAYVCIRNIAMAASWTLCEKPDFSRYSPFKLKTISQCPIKKDEYEVSMACRMASQRGAPPPTRVNAEYLIDIYNRVEPWVEEIRLRLREGINGQ